VKTLGGCDDRKNVDMDTPGFGCKETNVKEPFIDLDSAKD